MQAEPTFRAAADLGYRLCSPERRVRVVEVVEQSSDTRHRVDAGPLSGALEDTVLGRPISQPAGYSDIRENCSTEFLAHHAEMIAQPVPGFTHMPRVARGSVRWAQARVRPGNR